MDKEIEAIWTAGLIDGMGTLYVADNTVRLVLKSVGKDDALERAATFLGSTMNECKINKKPGSRITIQGEKLKRVMKDLWPYLTTDRKRQYYELVKRAAE